MSEKEVLEEKIKEKKSEKEDMKDYVDKMLNKSYEETKGMFEAHQKHEAEKHNHATHSSEAFCPECGDKNPDFKAIAISFSNLSFSWTFCSMSWSLLFISVNPV